MRLIDEAAAQYWAQLQQYEAHHKVVSDRLKALKAQEFKITRGEVMTTEVTCFETNEREEKSEPKGGWKFCGICGGELQDLIRWTQECWWKDILTLTKIIPSVVTENKGIAEKF